MKSKCKDKQIHHSVATFRRRFRQLHKRRNQREARFFLAFVGRPSPRSDLFQFQRKLGKKFDKFVNPLVAGRGEGKC